MIDRARRLIEQVAEQTEGVAPLVESVKWGEPSFTPAKRNVGSSVRLQERDNGDVALMFICHTGLVDEFRALYGAHLEFEGNRAIVLPADGAFGHQAVKHCIALALTYHERKRTGH